MPTIGTAQCIICRRDIPIKKNDKGTLSFSCGYCDVTIYSKRGTESHGLLSKVVKLSVVDVDEDHAPAEVAASSAPAAARAAPASSPAKMPWLR
jgi:hypothetical protein